jgi:hypothetical protein
MDLEAELILREQIMHELSSVTAAQGYATRAQLSALQIGSQVRRVIDTSKGIWNPNDLAGTLSIPMTITSWTALCFDTPTELAPLPGTIQNCGGLENSSCR